MAAGEEAERVNSRSVRGDFLLSPVFVLSLIALLVNDFLLKPYYPGAVSGLLSDVAGMVFFPVFAVALAEFAAALLPSRPKAKPSWFVVASLLTAVLFVVFKFTEVGEQVFITVSEPLRASVGALMGYEQRGLVADPWDLLALLMLPVPVWLGYRFRGSAV